jgi:hypothetical protein
LNGVQFSAVAPELLEAALEQETMRTAALTARSAEGP